MKNVRTLRILFFIFLLLPLLFACERPPKERIEKDFKSLQKINPIVNLPRLEWELSKASGYWIQRIYKEEGVFKVEIKLKKPYYKKENIRMYYRKEPDGAWKFTGWEFFRK